MRFSVSSLRVASAVAAFFVKWSAVVIVKSRWSSQGVVAVRSSGLLFSASGGRYSASWSAVCLRPCLMSRCLMFLLLTAIRAGWSSLDLSAFSFAVRMFPYSIVPEN